MASSNVSYYEKQKELQDTITNCEQRRMELDKEFRLALQADQTSSKMKAARLNAYWKKICEDERRAKQRNEMMLREFERIDAHMAEMHARTQRLALVKRQYEDYICRTYPQWNELMKGPYQSKQQGDYQQQQRKPAQSSHESPRGAEEDPPPTHHQINATSSHLPEKDSPRTQQVLEPEGLSGLQTQQKKLEHQNSKQLLEQQQLQQQQQQQQQQHHHQQQQVQRSKLQEQPNASQNNQLYNNRTKPDNPQMMPEPEQSTSEYANLPGPAPQQDHREQQSSTHQEYMKEIDQHSPSKNGSSPDEQEDEETSEFGSDTDIPMGQSLGNTQVRANVQQQKEVNKISGPIKPELSAAGLFHLLHVVEADISEAFSLEGYYRSSWPDSATKANIIRAANAGGDLSRVDAGLISMVVLEQVTLIVRNLAEGSLLPSVLLEGNVRNLSEDRLRQHLSPEAQVIWDALSSHFVVLVTANVMEPQELSAIFTPSIVGERGDQEKGHAFIVHLVQGMKAKETESHVKSQQEGQVWGPGISPKTTLEGSGSFAEDGRVPPLKFGSLLDKPMSDDESSYVNSSLPRDAVPLNETEAYKNMISGTQSLAPLRQQSSGPEDTDDDVEKQIATAIATKPVVPVTPRTARDEVSETSSQTLTAPGHSASHVYVPTAMEIKQQPNPLQSSQNKFQGIKISSDLDTDTEVDAGIYGSSRKQEDNFDFDFYD